MRQPRVPHASPAVGTSPWSLRQYIEAGLKLSGQGQYAEATAFFAFARDALQDDGELARSLDNSVARHHVYRQAETALFNASRRFAQASTGRDEALAALARLLPHAEGLSPLPPVSAPMPRATPLWAYAEPVGSAPCGLPALEITCFGTFRIRRLGGTVELCRNRNGQAILRYLASHPQRRETADVLMETFWPDDDGVTARRKLQVAVSALRMALNNGHAGLGVAGAGYILCRNDIYQLNPEVEINVDVDRFLALYHEGRRAAGAAMIQRYEDACRLHSGPFLVEDLYADWSHLRREQLARTYLSMCSALAEHYYSVGQYDDAALWATLVLQENNCDESAHRQLIRIYAAAGRRNDAVRQYLLCRQTLANDLAVEPMPETDDLFHDLFSASAP